MSIRPLPLLLTGLLCLGFLTACTLVPGPRLDESRMQDDLSVKTADTVYPVALITPQVIAAQQPPNFPLPAGLENNSTRPSDYRVGIGDIVGVTIWNHPELTAGNGANAAAVRAPTSASASTGGVEIDASGQRVAGDGTIFFPTVGRVHVAGDTTTEIGVALTQKLTQTTLNPQLEVHVLQYLSQQVQVTGALTKPGALPITDTPLRVVDALARSGGTLATADLQRVQLTRADQTVTLNIDAALTMGKVNQNVILQDGDILNVPDHTESRIYVLGEVVKPQMLYMNQGRLTLADAIASVNSIDPNSADPRQIYVIRRSLADPGKPALYRLDMSQIDAILLTTQFQLQPLDIVYVGTATLTRFNRALGQLLPTAESIYLIHTF